MEKSCNVVLVTFFGDNNVVTKMTS